MYPAPLRNSQSGFGPFDLSHAALNRRGQPLPYRVPLHGAWLRPRAPSGSVIPASLCPQCLFELCVGFRKVRGASTEEPKSHMRRLIECVPNFSEGRDHKKLQTLVAAMNGIKGAWMLDLHTDPDHNRSVVTLAGEPEAVIKAALCGVGKAAELIDLRHHRGEHPRIGAIDVLPFVPVEGVSMDDCVALARQAGQEIWARYKIPVYLYEEAALRPERKRLESVRSGEFEYLRDEVLRGAGRTPDIGGPRLHPSAGAVAVGARKFLIAYNVNLDTPNVSIAKKIARTIRASNGGLPHVKAIGVELKDRKLAQVSTNLTDFEQTSLRQVFDAVRLEGERSGCSVRSSEIVGLVPGKALGPDDAVYLRLENFESRQKILETRLEMMINEETADGISLPSIGS
jgi:glutamate formiminotransferase